MSTSLGEVFVEIVGDADPLAADLSSALSDIGDTISAELSGAFDGVTDGLAGDFAEAGNEAGGALVDGVESEVDGLDIDTSGAFDGLSADAQGAADDVGSAFDGVGEQIESSLSGAFDGITGSLGSLQGALGTAAGGAGLEGFARSQQDATLSVQRGAERMGETEDAVRSMIDGITDWTFSSADAAAGMELLNQRGIDNIDTVEELLPVWDNFADATGGDFVQSMEDGMRALGAFGIPAEEAGDHIDTLTFMTNEIDVPMDRLARQLRNNGDELDEMGLGLDESAGLLAALGAKGIDGRDAVAMFGRAVKGSEGDLDGLLSELGLTTAEFEEYTGKVRDAEGITERQAAQANDLATPMERLGGWVENVAFKFGDMGQMAGMLAAPLGALGPAMFGLNQASSMFAKVGPVMGKALGGVAKAFNVLRVAILTNPIFLIGAVLIGLGILIWKFRDEIIEGLTAAWDWIKDTAGALWEWLTDAFSTGVDAVVEFVSGLRDRVVEFFQGMIDTVTDAVSGWVDALVGFVTNLWEQYVAMVTAIRDAVVDWFTDLIETVVDAVTGWVSDLVGLVTDLWQRWVDLVHTIRDAVIDAIVTLVTTVVTTVAGWVESIVGFVRNLFARWVALQIAIRDAVVAAVRALIDRVVSNISRWVTTIVGFVTNLRDRWLALVAAIRDQVVQRVRDLVSRVVSTISGWVRNLLNFVRNLRRDFVGTIRQLVTDVITRFREIPRRIREIARNFGTLLLNAGRNLINGLIRGIREKIGDIGRAIGDAASAVTRFWPFSPAKEGPLRDRPPEDAGANIIGLMAGGMEANLGQLTKAARAAAQAALVDATAGSLPFPFGVESGSLSVPGSRSSVTPSEVEAVAGRSSRAGGMQVTQNIYTVEPRRAATEAVRKLRDAAYLGGSLVDNFGREVDRVGS